MKVLTEPIRGYELGQPTGQGKQARLASLEKNASRSSHLCHVLEICSGGHPYRCHDHRRHANRTTEAAVVVQ